MTRPVWHASGIYPGAVLPHLTGGAWSAFGFLGFLAGMVADLNGLLRNSGFETSLVTGFHNHGMEIGDSCP